MSGVTPMPVPNAMPNAIATMSALRLGTPQSGKVLPAGSAVFATSSQANPTLTPNLGVVKLSGDRSFAVADVPGLIEGAHRGLGLGHQFLRHLERTKVLVHVVDVSGAAGRDPVEDLDTVRQELQLFQPALAAKPQIVAANKMDAVTDETEAGVAALGARAASLGLPFLRVSAATGAGMPELLEAMWRHIAVEREAEHAAAGSTPA